jgi:hypothetical protein
VCVARPEGDVRRVPSAANVASLRQPRNVSFQRRFDYFFHFGVAFASLYAAREHDFFTLAAGLPRM